MMKNYSYLLLLGVAGLVFIFGCNNAQKPQDTLTLQNEDASLTTIVSVDDKAALNAAQKTLDAAIPAANLVVPESPSEKDIQVALKGAGLYDGEIDGKIGPKTKKAIEDFQANNGLTADGKVGPKTWEKLKAYFTGSVQPAPEFGVTE